MARKKSNRPRKKSDSHYVNLARANRRLVPSLNKYKGRKPASLSPQEKSAIQRAQNNIRKTQGSIIPLSEKQFKKLKKPHRPGRGIRGVVSNAPQPGDKFRATVNKRGEPVFTIKTQSGRKRRWRFIEVVPEPGLLIDAGIHALKRGASQVFIWNTHGRAGTGARTQKAWVENVAQFFQAYIQQNLWILGIAAFEQL